MVSRTLLILTIGFQFTSAAFGCSCSGDSTVTPETANYYAAVFEGQVVQIRLVERPIVSDKPEGPKSRTLHVTLRVSRSWKGVDQPEVEVTTPVEGATCGYHFEVADSYLIFARGEEPASLYVSTCSSTRRSKPDDPALAVLGPAKFEFARSLADESFWNRRIERPQAHLGQAPNQSLERTRSAAASGFAGQQPWRAAQLQIR